MQNHSHICKRCIRNAFLSHKILLQAYWHFPQYIIQIHSVQRCNFHIPFHCKNSYTIFITSSTGIYNCLCFCNLWHFLHTVLFQFFWKLNGSKCSSRIQYNYCVSVHVRSQHLRHIMISSAWHRNQNIACYNLFNVIRCLFNFCYSIYLARTIYSPRSHDFIYMFRCSIPKCNFFTI